MDVVYEDNDVLVIDKPAGMPVHPDMRHEEGTVIQEIQKKYPKAELVHRLDKDTSGLLLIAKHAKAHVYMKELFKNRAITKKYLALVVGEVKKNEGNIRLDIGRSRKDFKKRVAKQKPEEGTRSAETHYKVLKRPVGFTLLEVTIKTGRTHQIRSHLASIGHPVACDTLYGGKRYACPAGVFRQFLHAYLLEFSLPNGKRLRLESELPADLKLNSLSLYGRT